MFIAPQENYMFEVKDWCGRTVRLTRRTFETHKERHPEFTQYIEAAKQTIQDPDLVAEADNGGTSLVRFGLGRKPFGKLYLVVIVFYRGAEGTEATHHFTSRLGDLRIIETRHVWLAGKRFSLGGKSNE